MAILWLSDRRFIKLFVDIFGRNRNCFMQIYNFISFSGGFMMELGMKTFIERLDLHERNQFNTEGCNMKWNKNIDWYLKAGRRQLHSRLVNLDESNDCFLFLISFCFVLNNDREGQMNKFPLISLSCYPNERAVHIEN